MSRNLRKAVGFTLIELMMVVAIITILAGIALQFGGTFTQEEQLRELSRAVVGGLGQARAEAVRRGTKISVNFSGGLVTAFTDANSNYQYDVGESMYYQYKYDATKYSLTTPALYPLTAGNPAGAMTAIFDYQGYLNTYNGVPMAPVICVKSPALQDVRAVSMTMSGVARISIYDKGKALCP